MKKFVLAVTLILTFSFLPAFSASTPKPGSLCSKQGMAKTYKGKKYTCIKSGKKLVWNKGVLIRKPIPTVTPSPFWSQTSSPSPKPTPSPTDILDIQKSAEFISLAKDWNLQFARNQNWEPALDVYISSNISPIIKSQYAPKAIEQIQIGRKILKAFGFEFAPKYSYALFTEKDKVWVEESFGFSCGLPDEWFLDRSSKIQDGGQCYSPTKGYVVFQVVGTRNSLSDLDFTFGPVHEMFHSVQQILMNVDFGDLQSNYSCWFVESMPNLFNYLVLGSQGQDSLNRALNLRLTNFNRFVEGSVLLQKYGFEKTLLNWSLDDWTRLALTKPAFGEKCRTADDQYIGFGYWVGSIFSERLILDYGMQSYLDFLQSIGRSNNYLHAFKEFTSMDELSWLKTIAIPYLLGQVKLN